MWHTYGKEGGRQERPSRGTPETIHRVGISEEVTTEELRMILGALLIRSGGRTERVGFVLAVGKDAFKPWEGLSARRIPKVDKTWIKGLQRRDLILCPSEMMGPMAQISPGIMIIYGGHRQRWERAARMTPHPELKTLLMFCTQHQFSGLLTPVLPDRDRLVRFLNQASLVLESHRDEYPDSVILAVAMLGDIQRHPLLLMGDLERTPFTTAREVRDAMSSYERNVCFRTRPRAPEARPREIYPIFANELTSTTQAIWASMATQDFPYLGLPMATHMGDVTPWPFSPDQGIIMSTIATLIEKAKEDGTALVGTGEPTRQEQEEETDQDQSEGSGQDEWGRTHIGSTIEPTA
jgi:hypothetical protein